MADRHGGHPGGFFGSPTSYVFVAFLAVGGYLLWTEHRAHLLSVLPFAVLLLCPILHLFHRHGNHGGGREKEGGKDGGGHGSHGDRP